MPIQLEQFQSFTRINCITLRRAWKNLVESSQLQIVDAEQPVSVFLNQRIKRSCPTVVALHRDQDFTTVTALMAIDAGKKVRKPLRTVVNIKFVHHRAVC